MDRFDYYLVRVRRRQIGDPTEALAGVIERLGTGEKTAFAAVNELIALIRAGSAHSSDSLVRRRSTVQSVEGGTHHDVANQQPG